MASLQPLRSSRAPPSLPLAHLLLSCCVPNVELDGSPTGVEKQGVDLNSQRSDVLLLELSSKVTLDEGSLTNASISH